jgi:hypothetical protein
MADPQNPDQHHVDAETEHAILALSLPFLLWLAFLLLAGAVAHYFDASFRLGPWVWQGSFLGKLGKGILVAFPLAFAAFGSVSLILGTPVRRRW